MAYAKQSGRRAFSAIELLVTVACIALLASVLLPALGFARGKGPEEISANNLRQLGMMHVAYAADWNGRQWTVTPDDLTTILGGNPCASYSSNYSSYPQVPPVTLGNDCDGNPVSTSQGWAIQPMWYAGNCSLGNFRAWNTRPFNLYANGRVYDPLFWAPRDPFYKDRQDQFNNPCEWPGGTYWFPTYCMSVAAQVDPEVYRGPQDGGSQRANCLPLGHRTPSLSMARYPDQKTHMLEHYWLNPPPRDPFIPGTGGVPWFYNMSPQSEPMTLFFDGSVRKLPVLEVLWSNTIVVQNGGDKLWANDAGCFGASGYFEQYRPRRSFYPIGLTHKTTSYHVFTRDGILGRDTIFNK